MLTVWIDYKRSDILCNCEMGFEVESSVPNQMHWVTQRTSRQLTKHIRLWALFWKEVKDINSKIQASQNMTLKAFIPRGKTRCAHILLSSPSHNTINLTSLVRLSSSSPSQHASCEDQLRRKMLEKIIRVDHAGEMGASFIYQGMSIIKHFGKTENRLT